MVPQASASSSWLVHVVHSLIAASHSSTVSVTALDQRKCYQLCPFHVHLWWHGQDASWPDWLDNAIYGPPSEAGWRVISESHLHLPQVTTAQVLKDNKIGIQYTWLLHNYCKKVYKGNCVVGLILMHICTINHTFFSFLIVMVGEISSHRPLWIPGKQEKKERNSNWRTWRGPSLCLCSTTRMVSLILLEERSVMLVVVLYRHEWPHCFRANMHTLKYNISIGYQQTKYII